MLITLSPIAVAQEGKPTVTRTFPVDGAADVAAGETKLVVEFSHDMADSYSWTKGGELFPQVIKAPEWETPRKCVLTVNLLPNHLYTFGVNGFTANRFQDTSGVPVERKLVSFRTEVPNGETPVTFRGGPENRAVFNALKKAFDDSYSYRNLRDVNWTRQFDVAKERFISSKTADELTYHVADLLTLARDPHISLERSGVQFATFARTYTPNFSSKALGHAVENLNKLNNTVYAGRYEDGVVYVLITSWANDRAADLSALGKFLDGVKDAPGIILDVRPNGGGNDLFCQALARRFVAQEFVYEKVRTRDTSRPNGFSEARERVLMPLPSGPSFGGKVAVLMGPANMSSCEAFLLMMKPIKQARLFGQPSYGSSGNPQPHDIGAGITVQLPSWQALLPDDQLLEGTGVTPDILVETTVEDFEEQDLVINAALKWLRED
ncbi:MAG: S41 family peptidase [Pirellulales bacterium]|nr:S41 family peptidase [Pirellulales bacterium]